MVRLPSGPGVIPDELIREIAQSVPTEIKTFLLTSETTSENIVGHHHRTSTDTIQVVDHVDYQIYLMIRQAIPSVKLVQVIHVIAEESLDEALAAAEHADMLLLDSGNPRLKVKVLGGTGHVHDWKISRRILEQVEIPVFLAGGLHAGNVRAAIEEVEPYGVDLCSGVRVNGNLDPFKLESFLSQIINLK